MANTPTTTPCLSSRCLVAAFARAWDLNNEGAKLVKLGQYEEAIRRFHCGISFMHSCFVVSARNLEERLEVTCACCCIVKVTPRIYSTTSHDPSCAILPRTKTSESKKSRRMGLIHHDDQPLSSRESRSSVFVEDNHIVGFNSKEEIDDEYDENNFLFSEPLFVEYHSSPDDRSVDEAMGGGISVSRCQKGRCLVPCHASISPPPKSNVNNNKDRKSITDLSAAVMILNTALAYHLLYLSRKATCPPFQILSTTVQFDQTNDTEEHERQKRMDHSTSLKLRAKRLYQKAIQLLMILLGDREKDHHGSCNIEVHKQRTVCYLAILASMNNLLCVTGDDDDVNRDSLLAVYYQIANSWLKESEDKEVNMESHERLLHPSTTEECTPNRCSLSTLHKKWRAIFIGNAIVMQLRAKESGQICMSCTADAA